MSRMNEKQSSCKSVSLYVWPSNLRLSKLPLLILKHGFMEKRKTVNERREGKTFWQMDFSLSFSRTHKYRLPVIILFHKKIFPCLFSFYTLPDYWYLWQVYIYINMYDMTQNYTLNEMYREVVTRWGPKERERGLGNYLHGRYAYRYFSSHFFPSLVIYPNTDS